MNHAPLCFHAALRPPSGGWRMAEGAIPRRLLPVCIDARLVELGLELPEPSAPGANYVPFVRTGNLVFVTGQLSQWNGERRFIGKLGREFDVEEGQQAARLCALNVISSAPCGLGRRSRSSREVRPHRRVRQLDARVPWSIAGDEWCFRRLCRGLRRRGSTRAHGDWGQRLAVRRRGRGRRHVRGRVATLTAHPRLPNRLSAGPRSSLGRPVL